MFKDEDRKIVINGKNISSNKKLVSTLTYIVSMGVDGHMVVNKSDQDQIVFACLGEGNAPRIKEALTNYFKRKGLDLTLGKTALAQGFSDSSLAVTKASPQLCDINVAPQNGHRITNDDHRVIKSLCEKYGGTKPAVVVGHINNARQQELGMVIKDIPSFSLCGLEKSLSRSLGRKFAITHVNTDPEAPEYTL